MLKFTIGVLSVMLAADLSGATAARLKDLLAVEGVRDNQLVGYGIVVGLNGTGDKRQTVFSSQSLTNMLQRMGVTVSPSAILVRNMAAVIVTATLPPFAQPGTKIDVTAAAIGDASNLQGGLLVLTSLKGPDGQVYAVAQGSVVTGGFVAGRGGNTQTQNHPTVGRIPEGAVVERSPPSVSPTSAVRLQLKRADFTTAARVVETLNRKFGTPAQSHPAKAESSGLIEVRIPVSYSDRPVEFVAEIEGLPVESDRPQRVVLNERTGTIVLGKDVRIAPISILHGGLTVEIQTAYQVSQPQPLSQGQTAITPQVGVGVKADPAKNLSLKDGATVEDLVRGLTAIGGTSRDIIAVLQSLKAAGALEADLEVL